MAAIIDQPLSKTGAKRHALKIDMTPMVDLGFLLISFFIFTTSLTQPTVTRLNMPANKDREPPQPVYKKVLLTIVVSKEKNWVYEGAFAEAQAQNGVKPTSFDAANGFGKIIRQKQTALAKENLGDDLTVLIKPLPAASYQDLMNALDEMTVNCVKRYAVVDASPEEKAFALH